ncbi:MAG TPA: M48 family metalloprotease [Steroidobacteraceae bacterium]|nr:M48 family metalloprotease [Steroidobacteraceae bacterium]
MRNSSVIAVALAGSLALSACGTNPVTGKREIQFVSQAEEIQMGEQNYAPTRQGEGGDFSVLPELSAYVNEIGQKLAAVSDRKLPYEFTVLNNSVPNAWALPGGKIAVNRGLLYELQSEAELAAVLGHEIVHAAARHGAKAQERGTLMQAGMQVAQIGAAVGGVDANLASLVLQGAGAGAQMIQMKYGRDQELEADHYGMKYMKLVGYDPWGAVTLQETFVKLFGDAEKNQDWMSGMFASHPPSAERVEQNKKTAGELGRGGEINAEAYQARVKPLLEMKPAYDKYDEAMAAAQKGDTAKAKTLVAEAAKMQPNEGLFQQMLGEIALSEKKPKEARAYYQKAMQLNPNYYGSYLGAGVAEYRAGDKAKAEQYLGQSAKLLPTAPAAYFLGQVSKDKGDTETALKYYQAAATSNSNVGQAAAVEALRIDLPRNPGNYVATAPVVAANQRVVAVIENRAPLPLMDIQLTPVLVDASGNIVKQASPITIGGPVKPGERSSVDAGVGALDAQTLQSVRFRVDTAKVVEPAAQNSPPAKTPAPK